MCFSKTQIELARRLGMIAFARGAERAPSRDPKLMAMLEGRDTGITPDNEASSVRIKMAWSKAWERSEALKYQERVFDDPNMTAFDKLLQLLSEKDAKYTVEKLSLLSGRKKTTVKNVISKIRTSGVNLISNNKYEYFIQ